MAGVLRHAGDADTYIEYAPAEDTINIAAGGSVGLDITGAGVRMGEANARVTTILDEDDMASDSATALATQQSIRHYWDFAVGTYAGNDAANRTIAVGFQPTWVMVVCTTEPTSGPHTAFAVTGIALAQLDGTDYWQINTAYFQGIVATGFQCGDQAANCINQTGDDYYWVAGRK